MRQTISRGSPLFSMVHLLCRHNFVVSLERISGTSNAYYMTCSLGHRFYIARKTQVLEQYKSEFASIYRRSIDFMLLWVCPIYIYPARTTPKRILYKDDVCQHTLCALVVRFDRDNYIANILRI